MCGGGDGIIYTCAKLNGLEIYDFRMMRMSSNNVGHEPNRICIRQLSKHTGLFKAWGRRVVKSKINF